jgi:DNA-binding transcriptional LysR family regulator
MNIDKVDLNLLRLFNAIYTTGSVTRAAALLNLNQPVASQGLARLRLSLGDALFERVAGGVRPSPRAESLAPTVRAALAMLDHALAEGDRFDPQQSRRVFRLHMSDIGEGRFLPALMERLRRYAPSVRVETQYVEQDELAGSLDSGKIDVAYGFLPQLKGMQSTALLTDHYAVVVKKDHPFARVGRSPQAIQEALMQLQFLAVRTHTETTRILGLLRLDHQLRLTVEHFTALPSIVKATDLAAIMPMEVWPLFPPGEFAVVDPRFPTGAFTVSLHWSRRFDQEPGNRWFRELALACVPNRPQAPRA